MNFLYIRYKENSEGKNKRNMIGMLVCCAVFTHCFTSHYKLQEKFNVAHT